ncbi:hypothetical protein F4808DRAFT_434244 [Astrocystis sublimbata]|nr:hypothetical protein F4808DRAFT_434244 [Astrocystis sublimbata]
MRTTLLATALSAASGVRGAIDATAVRSYTTYQCNAVGGVRVSFDKDMTVMHASFPDLNLYVDTPSHGFPPSYSIMHCLAEVEFNEQDFGSGYRQARFAIKDVTWTAKNLTLEKGDNLKQLRGKIDLNVEVDNKTSPVHYPIGKDKYSANLVNIDFNPAVAVDEAFNGEYKVTQKNPNPYFTPCFLGRSSHALKFDFDIYATTVDGGVSAGGWDVDFGLIYEECHWTESTDNWGQTQIKAWESCYYREATNQTASKMGLRGLY